MRRGEGENMRKGEGAKMRKDEVVWIHALLHHIINIVYTKPRQNANA
jgi:hypothetical protein